jgi:hypothetical protein
LSRNPHPRDKRACLPKISSPHSVYINELDSAILKDIFFSLKFF